MEWEHGVKINELTILEKTSQDEVIKITCQMPQHNFKAIAEYSVLQLKPKSNQELPNLWGIVVKTQKNKGLITIILKNTGLKEPLMINPLLEKNLTLEYQKLGRVLPPLATKSMQKVMIIVDGFWINLASYLISTLKAAGCEVSISGPFSIKWLNNLSLTLVDIILPIDTFISISKEIIDSDADTIISLNTPLWQRKITSLMWSQKINKYLITVNNQWLDS